MKKQWFVDSNCIEKQLKDDFCVKEYLRENCLGKYGFGICSDNPDQFVRFYDEVLVGNRQKAERVAQLRQAYTSGMKLGATVKRPSTSVGWYPDRSAELQQLAKQTAQQASICNQLDKTLTQYKKTLVLLKGDIGHIISRNESEKLLQSKIHKVKIVANDQYGKVSSELSKDIAENRELTMMQSLFLARMKQVRKMQVGQLGRAKDNFIELIANQQNMNEKLNTIEQRSFLIKEEVELNRQKNHNNYVVAYVSKLLSELKGFIGSKEVARIIDESSLKMTYQRDPQDYRRIDLLAALTSCKDAITEQLNKMQKQKSQAVPTIKVEQTVEAILAGYRTIKINLEGLSVQYTQSLSKAKGLRQLLYRLTYLRTNHNEDEQDDEDYGCCEETVVLQQRLIVNLKLTVVFLNFFHNFLKVREGSKHKSLLKDLLELISLEISDCNLESLFDGLVERFKKAVELYRAKLRDVFSSPPEELYRKPNGLLIDYIAKSEEQLSQRFGEDASSGQIEGDPQPSKEMVEGEKQQPNYVLSLFSRVLAKAINLHSNNQHKNVPAALRVQFLNDIDKDYSHMLKKTLKMEKDHTRKNYEFQRHFQRDKYVNRDAIPKEKRFQSSFSHLWRSNNTSHHRANNHNASARRRQSRRVCLENNTPMSSSAHSPSAVKKPNKLSRVAALTPKTVVRRQHSVARGLSWNVRDLLNC